MRPPRLLAVLLSLVIGGSALVAGAGTASAAALDTALTLTRSPARVLYGAPVHFTGTLTYASSPTTQSPVAGAMVALQRQIFGATSFNTIAVDSTDATGRVDFNQGAPAGASYRLVFAGTVDRAATTSIARTVEVRRDLGALEKHLSGREFAFHGKVVPSYHGRVIYLQKKTCSTCAWKTVAHKQTSSASRWRFVVLAKPTAGKWRYRTVTPAGMKFLRSPSVTFVITSL